ncbi:hypothetical protein BIT28_24785 [Photobacterium proteolyticum]|uniref:Uncharacterized protein n=1 Tax=Photobacterium proteolyticum TaxID=1903952 RepID=A0A1Q9GCZ7_9GAMM|nr:hypothetical protein BIT28_24785 [Photobacterium proteolyticum]
MPKYISLLLSFICLLSSLYLKEIMLTAIFVTSFFAILYGVIRDEIQTKKRAKASVFIYY